MEPFESSEPRAYVTIGDSHAAKDGRLKHRPSAPARPASKLIAVTTSTFAAAGSSSAAPSASCGFPGFESSTTTTPRPFHPDDGSTAQRAAQLEVAQQVRDQYEAVILHKDNQLGSAREEVHRLQLVIQELVLEVEDQEVQLQETTTSNEKQLAEKEAGLQQVTDQVQQLQQQLAQTEQQRLEVAGQLQALLHAVSELEQANHAAQDLQQQAAAAHAAALTAVQHRLAAARQSHQSELQQLQQQHKQQQQQQQQHVKQLKEQAAALRQQHEQEMNKQRQTLQEQLAAAHLQHEQQQQQLQVELKEAEDHVVQVSNKLCQQMDDQRQALRAEAERQVKQAAEEAANLADKGRRQLNAPQAELTHKEDQLRETLQQQQDSSTSLTEQVEALQKEVVATNSKMEEEKKLLQKVLRDLKVARENANQQENLAGGHERNLRKAKKELEQERERSAKLAQTLASSMNMLLEEKTEKVLLRFVGRGTAAGKGINGVVERGRAHLYSKDYPDPNKIWKPVAAVRKCWTLDCAEEGVYQLLLALAVIKRAAKDPTRPQVPKLLGFQARGANLYMVLEDCGISLADLLQDVAAGKVRMSQQQQLQICEQILQHLQELHSRGWAHVDLKPENILINLTSVAEGIVLKLCDFSHSINSAADAAEVQRGGPMVGGTPGWTCPLVHANFPGVKRFVELLNQLKVLNFTSLPQFLRKVLSKPPRALTLEELQRGDRFAAAAIIWYVLTGTRLQDQPGYHLTMDAWQQAAAQYGNNPEVADMLDMCADQAGKLVDPTLPLVNMDTLLRYLPRADVTQLEASSRLATNLALTLRELGEGENVSWLLGTVQGLRAILG